jgi:hypothetical protein
MKHRLKEQYKEAMIKKINKIHKTLVKLTERGRRPK